VVADGSIFMGVGIRSFLARDEIAHAYR